MHPARVQASSGDFSQKSQSACADSSSSPNLSEAGGLPSRFPIHQKKERDNMSLRNRLLQLTLVVLSLACGIQAQDTQHCSNATMHGSYGFHATGKEFVAIGRFVFNGNGGLAGKLFVRVPGTNIGPLEIAGTYSVGPDCIMT